MEGERRGNWWGEKGRRRFRLHGTDGRDEGRDGGLAGWARSAGRVQGATSLGAAPWRLRLGREKKGGRRWSGGAHLQVRGGEGEVVGWPVGPKWAKLAG
jgi:hypothetical protein